MSANLGLSENIDLPLNDNAKACVEYYLSHLPYNMSAAYKAVYPSNGRSQGTLNNKASAFFKNPRVQRYKEQRLKELYEEANINPETIAMRLAGIAFDTRDEVLNSSLKALDLLQKQLGLQNKNVNMNADINAGITIIDDYGSEETTENK